MGTPDLLTQHLKEIAWRNGSSVLVIASAPHTDALQTASPAISGMKIASLENHQPVSDELMRESSLLVIEVDPGEPATMQRLKAVRERYPHIPLVAAMEGASVSLVRTLMREGVSDVVSLPFDLDELLQVSLDTVAKHQTAQTEQALAPMLAVARSLGGCGATSIATHLAADLAAHCPNGRGVVIADLDLQFGSVAEYLGVRPRGTLADLLDSANRLDEELLRSVAADAGNGIAVLAAPETIMPLESIDTDDLLRVLKLLRQQYDYVVLDLPADWTNWTLSAALAADAIMLVVELSVASLRQAKRRLDLFRSVGVDDRAIQIVVNRVEKRLFRTIDLDDVAQTLSHPVLGSVSLDSPTVATAQTQGHLVGDIQRKSRFVKDIAQIGEVLRTTHLARGAS